MKICAAGSPATGSRKIWTRVTSRSSSAQPPSAIDPLTCAPSAGASSAPNGGCTANPACRTVNTRRPIVRSSLRAVVEGFGGTASTTCPAVFDCTVTKDVAVTVCEPARIANRDGHRATRRPAPSRSCGDNVNAHSWTSSVYARDVPQPAASSAPTLNA